MCNKNGNHSITNTKSHCGAASYLGGLVLLRGIWPNMARQTGFRRQNRRNLRLHGPLYQPEDNDEDLSNNVSHCQYFDEVAMSTSRWCYSLYIFMIYYTV